MSGQSIAEDATLQGESANLEAALTLIRSGFKVFPCRPNKKPRVDEWGQVATGDEAQIRAWWRQWPDAMPGLPTGERNGLSVIDLDRGHQSGVDGIAEWVALGRSADEGGLIVETPGGGRHLWFAYTGERNTTGKKVKGVLSGIAEGVDSRGQGGYVLGPGAVKPDGGCYRIVHGSLEIAGLGMLPDFPREVLPKRGEPDTATTGTPDDVDRADLRRALQFIPADLAYGEWVKVLAGLHHATGGDAWGRAQAHAWSADDPRYEAAQVDSKWRSFGATEHAPITAASLYSLARDHGYQAVTADAFDDDGDLPEDSAPKANLFAPASDLAGLPVPPRRWLIPGMIPDRVVTLLGGDGGAGKSLIALQLAVAVATDGEWLGHTVARPGTALFLSAEDERDELHTRLHDICRSEEVNLADLGNLRFRSTVGEDAILATADPKTNVLRRTDLYRRLDAEMKPHAPAVLILDTLADLHAVNENDRAQVRQFVGILRRLALRHNCAIVVLAHPSRAGMADGSGQSGSTAWNGSVRSRLYLDRIKVDGVEPDPDARRLTVMKANYGPSGGEIRLRYSGGAFLAESPDAHGRFADTSVADAAFLAALAIRNAQGRWVNATSGATYAPSVLAKMTEAGGCTRLALRAAMERLLRRDALEITDYRADGKDRKRLEVTGRNATAASAWFDDDE